MTRFGAVLRGIFLISTLVLVGVLISEYAFLHGPETLKQWADAEIRGAGATGILVFIAVGAVFTGVGLPRQVFAIAGHFCANASRPGSAAASRAAAATSNSVP